MNPTQRIVRPAISRVVSPATVRWWQTRNRSRPRVLLYTDSRGTNVTGVLGKSVFGTYVAPLADAFHITPVVLPHRHTTLIDFLNFWDSSSQRYDAVVLHCGIVDFSPRPVSGIPGLIAGKSGLPRYADLFQANERYYAEGQGEPYEGQPTTTLYSREYLTGEIVPQLQAIPQLTWITTNDFVPGWEGNYHRGRPVDIGARIADLETGMASSLRSVIDLHAWSSAEVQRLTLDNVHFTPAGFHAVQSLIRDRLAEVLSPRR